MAPASSLSWCGRLPNQVLQRTGGTVAVHPLSVQTQVGGGFAAHR